MLQNLLIKIGVSNAFFICYLNVENFIVRINVSDVWKFQEIKQLSNNSVRLRDKSMSFSSL